MKKTASIYLTVVFLILYLPIFYLIGYAFNAGDDMSKFTGFSLTHFQNMFSDTRLMLILAQTFFLAFLSSKRNTKMPFYRLIISSWWRQMS